MVFTVQIHDEVGSCVSFWKKSQRGCHLWG